MRRTVLPDGEAFGLLQLGKTPRDSSWEVFFTYSEVKDKLEEAVNIELTDERLRNKFIIVMLKETVHLPFIGENQDEETE
jgi:hypothetical protein